MHLDFRIIFMKIGMSKGSSAFCDISILDERLKKKQNRAFVL